MADERDRESLRDLDGVRIAIEPLALASPVKGITADELAQAAARKLERAGIRLLNAGAYPVGDPYLRVQVVTSSETNGFTAYCVQVDFVQIVFLRRNPAVTFNRAETWKANPRLNLVPTSQLGPAILDELFAQLDQFVAAYRAVNA
ncbi:MAG TPA: hypothetical protein VKT49_24525 [Bryobacteraceae bacterium]|nr:hypothetical protein [Bryobacteraceae bacterium]